MVSNEKYMDDEAAALFLLWGQTEEDRAEMEAFRRECLEAQADALRVRVIEETDTRDERQSAKLTGSEDTYIRSVEERLAA